MQNNVPILKCVQEPKEDPTWTSFFFFMLHPDYTHPVFFRPNGSSVNLFNLYQGETVYLIGRGPSLGKILEDKSLKKLLMNNSIVKYGMNTSPEVLDNNVNIWSGVDKMKKFPSSILRNPNILKFIPMNRFQFYNRDVRKPETDRTVAYSDKGLKYTSLCPNIFGVQSFFLAPETKNNLSFAESYFGSTAVLYGYFKGFKSILLFSLKLCILLGFKRIVLLGVDFDMNTNEPYYQQKLSDYSKFHIEHNNKLYLALSPILKEIYTALQNQSSGYDVEIVSDHHIENLPFIPHINLKETLEEEIERKS